MIRLPPEITYEKRMLPGGGCSFDFRHRRLGALGRILVRDNPDGSGSHISLEVAGDPACAPDPRTAERRAIFEPLGLEISRQMAEITGEPQGAGPSTPLPPPPDPAAWVESKLIRCPNCDGFVAMLIFAPDAPDLGRFEDYARQLYPEYSRRGLPTWIIGPALGPGPEDPADMLKVWPSREPLKRLTPSQLNPQLEGLAKQHCRRTRLRANKKKTGF